MTRAARLLASFSLALALCACDQLAGKRKQCDLMIGKLCSDLGPDSQGCAMLKASPGDFSPEQCAAMLREYPQVLAVYRRQEEKNKPLDRDAQTKLAAGEPPAFGAADAKITLVEFSDFQCPFCSRAANAVHAIREKYGDKIRFVFRQYPLSFHENAHLSAEAALAAHAQGKFWELHDKMFANQSKLDRSALEAYAQDVGINVEDFRKALDTRQYAAVVDAELELGDEVGVDGTPTMFINGQLVADPTNIAYLSQLIDKALNANGS